MKIREIIKAVEDFAPPSLQEEYDNTGFQTGYPDAEASGALLCIDATEDIIDEAVAKGCNLLITHHPLLFRGVKCVIGRNRPECVLAKAIRNDITIYSSHTAMDSAVGGVSWRMAEKLGLTGVSVLVPTSPGASTGLGVVGDLPAPLSPTSLAELVKKAFSSPVVRMSQPHAGNEIRRVALCGGAAGEFVPQAIAAGAQAYITADCKHNQFIDHSDRILLIDAGHFETEACTKEIFFDILTEKFPNFAVCYSDSEKNPIIYL